MNWWEQVLVFSAFLVLCLMALAVVSVSGCGTRFDPTLKPDTRLLDYELTHKCHSVPGQFNDVCVPA